jgi:hypothetical protein
MLLGYITYFQKKLRNINFANDMAAVIETGNNIRNNGKGSNLGNTKATALDPRNGTLVQPFKRLVEEGFLTELVATFTPSGFTALGVPDTRLAGVEDSGLTAGVAAPLGIISAAADKGNLIPKRGDKKKASGKAAVQPAPLKTLTIKDFEGTTDEQLMARMRIVAAEGNGGTLIGRVRSAGRYLSPVTLSYQEWWERANPSDRALSLCQRKELSKLTDAHKQRLRGAPCPFRGTAEFHVAQESANGDDASVAADA